MQKIEWVNDNGWLIIKGFPFFVTAIQYNEYVFHRSNKCYGAWVNSSTRNGIEEKTHTTEEDAKAFVVEHIRKACMKFLALESPEVGHGSLPSGIRCYLDSWRGNAGHSFLAKNGGHGYAEELPGTMWIFGAHRPGLSPCQDFAIKVTGDANKIALKLLRRHCNRFIQASNTIIESNVD
jgi:hypothetical protein